MEVEITVDSTSRSASVSGRFSDGFRPRNSTNLVFLREAIGFPSLGRRISDIQLTDPKGNPVGIRKLMDGEFLADSEYRSWKYTVDLTPPKDRAGLAHASWIGDSTGMLVLEDLLPIFGRGPNLTKLRLPEGWNHFSAGTLSKEELSDSVVFIGKDHRIVEAKAASGDLALLFWGAWIFTDEEATQMAREVFDEYSKLFGDLPKKRYLIALQRFPGEHPHGHWEAETRGQAVSIFSSDMPFRTQSLQRLHEQLRHEIFHLWFPNGIDLVGDYAWFYEGFAMYSSLKLAVKLNRIRFDDFLDTLSRAHTIDTNSRPRKSLIDASIDPTVRYARGMLVAFLTDLQLLRNSGGKNDVGKSLKGLFTQDLKGPRGRSATDAVQTVVTDQTLIRRYVEGSDLVDWIAELAAAGIESKQAGRTTTLAVAAKLSGRQKEILDRLGYNNWRKIGIKK